MKKAFLFLLSIMVLTISCSSDDSSEPQSDDAVEGSRSITVTIDGVTKTFNTVIVNGDWGISGQTLQVEASINNSPLEILQFYIYSGIIGSNVIASVNYTTNGTNYYASPIQHVITINNESRFVGSFVGTTNGSTTSDQVTFTNGTIDLNK